MKQAGLRWSLSIAFAVALWAGLCGGLAGCSSGAAAGLAESPAAATVAEPVAEPASESAPEPVTEPEAESPLERRDRLRREALADAGLERRTLETEAGRLIYWQGGDGPPLVLLHGSGDSAGTFAAVAPDLIGDYRLLIPDLAGHGESEPVEGALPMATIVGGFEALLDAAALERPILAGNSMGAWLATLYAYNHPDRVSRVVAINGGPILGEPSGIKLMPADREEARASMAAIRDPSSPPVPDEVLDDIVARANSGPIQRMMLDLGGMMAYLLDGKLGEIATPVDLLWGESDGLMKLSYAERMAAGLPRARITRIPRCGHIPMGECPERFVGLLREILAAEPPAAAEKEPATGADPLAPPTSEVAPRPEPPPSDPSAPERPVSEGPVSEGPRR
jgi:pimeloyl-ACP methyl ester carboxylesterase